MRIVSVLRPGGMAKCTRALPTVARCSLAPRRAVLARRQRLGRLRLGVAQEGGELDEINAPLAVVVEATAAAPARPAVAGRRFGHGVRGRRLAGMAGEGRADEAFEPALRRVRGSHSVQVPP